MRFAILALVASLAATPVNAAGTIANALPQVNRVRVNYGLRPFVMRLDLQREAEFEAMIHARRNVGGHLRNGCWPGCAEGTGIGGRDPFGVRFHSCFHHPGDFARGYRYAGAAAATIGGTTHYVLILDR